MKRVPSGSSRWPPSPRIASVIRKFLTSRMVQAGRVELVEFHVRHAAAGAPGHGDAVAGRAVGIGRELIDAARPAGRQHDGAAGEALDPAGRDVEGIDAVAGAVDEAWRLDVALGDEVDDRVAGRQRDVGVGGGGAGERVLHRPAGGVVDMGDAAMAVAALAGQMEAAAAGVAVAAVRLADVERHADRGKPVDRGGGVLGDEVDGGAVVQATAGDHRVLDMAFERVAGFEHRGDAALRPGGRAVGDVAFRQDDDAEAVGEAERRRQPGGARTDDDDVVLAGLAHAAWLVSLRKTSSRSASRVETSTTPMPASVRRWRMSPAWVLLLS